MRTTLAVGLAVALAACGPKSMRAKVAEGEKLADRATVALDDAERALDELDADKAEWKLRDAEEAISRPEIYTNPESEMLKSRLAELKARVGPARAEKERRALDAKIAERREDMRKAATEFRKAVAALEQKQTRASLDEARAAARKVHDEVEWDKQLQEKDADFKAYADGLRQDIQAAQVDLEVTARAIEFSEGPLKLQGEARERVDRAKAEKALDQRLRLYEEAVEQYRRCSDDGQKLIDGTPRLASLTLVAAPSSASPASIAKACRAEVDKLAKLVAATKKALDKEQQRLAREQAKAQKKAKKKKGK